MSKRDEVFVVKQWGLQKTGTNLTKWLLSNGFAGVYVAENEGGWKHSTPQGSSNFAQYSEPSVGDPGLQIVNIRNPYSWIVSFIRYSRRNPPTLPSNFPKYNEEPDNAQEILKLWVRYMSEYLEFVETTPNSVLLRYEDIVLNTRGVVEKVAGKLNKTPSTRIRLPRTRVDPHTKGRGFNFAYERYKGYHQIMPKEIRRIIDSTVPREMRDLWAGYTEQGWVDRVLLKSNDFVRFGVKDMMRRITRSLA